MKKQYLYTLFATMNCLAIPHAHALIVEDFEAFTTNADVGAKYDFTKDGLFEITDTTPNTLGFYGGSGTDWTAKADPLDPGNMTLWVSGSDNPTNPGRGIYFMRLDATGGGAYTSGSVTISYSFRMMRDGFNVNSPTEFNVAWISTPDTSANLDMFTWVGETVHQSFSTSGNETNWVTVSGTITEDLSSFDTTSPYYTGIRVYATNGAFVSGGQGLYYVDDVSVTVVPEPRVFALVAGLAVLGLVIVRRRLS